MGRCMPLAVFRCGLRAPTRNSPDHPIPIGANPIGATQKGPIGATQKNWQPNRGHPTNPQSGPQSQPNRRQQRNPNRGAIRGQSGPPNKSAFADKLLRHRRLTEAPSREQSGGMRYPRHQIVDPEFAGFFHCVSRCVRRAFLCGQDTYTGRSYEHRKAWVEERLQLLSECFAAGLYAYAVMSNHVHVVLHMDPQATKGWTDKEVAERWVRLFPVCVGGAIDERLCQEKVRCLQGNPEHMVEIRSRLGSVSWFMRCLNEPIARQANREDGCTGRFWEGRFKCQVLLDEQAVLACMVYVDLNPIRAGTAVDLTESKHVSISRRLQRAGTEAPSTHNLLRPVAGVPLAPALSIRMLDYLELVDWSGRLVSDGKRGSIAPATPSVLVRLGLREQEWQTQMLGIESRYWRAVGTVEALMEKAKALGQRWLKGIGRAERALHY